MGTLRLVAGGALRDALHAALDRTRSLSALMGIAVLLGVGCSKNNQPGKQPGGKPGGGGPVPVIVAQAVAKTVLVELPAIGNVEAFSKVAVRSRITGELMRAHFQEGSDVSRGDLLFSIDPRPAEATLRQAEANLARDQAQAENARLDFERQKRLFEAALVSREEFDKAEAALKALQAVLLADRAAVSNATLSLEYTKIHAPIEGRTGNLMVHPGNIVQSGSDVLVTLNQLRPIFVEFSVPEQHLADIKSRLEASNLVAEARIPGLASPPPLGTVTFVDNTVDPTTGTIELKALFANTNGLLWPGQFVDVRLKLREQTNAVVVPSQAIQAGRDGDFVFLVKPDQTVEMRQVRPGLSRNGETVVAEGLQPGETVVVDGQLRLTPGAKIRISTGLTPPPPSSPVRKS